MSTLTWELDRCHARFSAAEWRVELDLARPADGLALSLPDEPCGDPARVLGLSLPGFASGDSAALIEPIVRGADLVAGYTAQPQWPIEVGARWRRLAAEPEAGDVLAVELLLSVHTQTLDSRPELAVKSRMTVAQTLPLPDAPACSVFRLVGEQWSYVEMVVPDDARHDRWSSTMMVPPCTTLAHRLFPVFLEKGVIFRTRLRGAIVPRENDLARAAALWRGFLASPMPLD